jgi:uncharacterized phage protein gp47/JayE
MIVLDENGFVKKEYADILDDMTAKAQQLFGADINTSASTPLGIIMRIFAWFLSICWDTAELVYNSGFVNKAEGVQLDNLGSNSGLQRNPAAHSYVELSFTGVPGTVIETETEFSTADDAHFLLIEDVTLDANGNGYGQATSEDMGAYTNVGAGTIIEQVAPDDSITSVTNPEAASGGADQEDDFSFRNRMIAASEGSGTATQNAIISALLTVSGVRSAAIVTNRTMQTDSAGNPPKSVHTYVLGGTAEEVAQALFNSVSAGTETVGSQQVSIADLSGNTHTISFDFAAEVQVYVKAVLTTNSAFPADGVQQVQNYIAQYIGGVDNDGVDNIGLGMNQDVRLSRLFGAVYMVDGIDDVAITIGKTPASLSENNIAIGPQQVAQTAVGQIEVDVNA